MIYTANIYDASKDENTSTENLERFKLDLDLTLSKVRSNYPFRGTQPIHLRGFDRNTISSSYYRDILNKTDIVLERLGEVRKKPEHIKKYLLIRLDSDVIYDILKNGKKELIFRSIPKWATDKMNRGEEVECFIVNNKTSWNLLLYDYEYDIITYSNSKKKLLEMLKSYDSRSRSNVISFSDGSVILKFNINSLIRAKIKEDFTYTDNIKDISERHSMTINELFKYGKYKDIYSVNINTESIVSLITDRQSHSVNMLLMLDYEVITTDIKGNKLDKPLIVVKEVSSNTVGMETVYF